MVLALWYHTPGTTTSRFSAETIFPWAAQTWHWRIDIIFIWRRHTNTPYSILLLDFDTDVFLFSHTQMSQVIEIILYYIRQWHCCWCPSYACHQCISSTLDIDPVVQQLFGLSTRMISIGLSDIDFVSNSIKLLRHCSTCKRCVKVSLMPRSVSYILVGYLFHKIDMQR